MAERLELTGRDRQIAWRPSAANLDRSRLLRFMGQHGIDSLDELLRRSTEDLDWFWRATLDDLDLQFYEPFEQVVDRSGGPEWPVWFPGGRYNYVHNALDKRVTGPDADREALVWE